MSGKHSFPLAAAILLVVPLAAPFITHAQRAAHFPGRFVAPRASSMRMSGMHPRMMQSQGRMMQSQGVVSAGGGFFSNTVGNITFFSPSVPGLNGINFVTNQDIGLEAAIDPATQWRLATAESALRNIGGFFPGSGFLLLDGGGAYAVPVAEEQAAVQPQPQVIVLQQAPTQAAAQPVQPEAVPAPQAAPLPDVGQFTLVLRNGNQIQAVAFTRANDEIVYITADGSRRTIASSDLDSDATMRVNEERGTPLKLPL